VDISGLTDVWAAWANVWYVFVAAGIIPCIIMGIFTSKLAKKKGYHGYFFTGFFFSLVGLIYVVGLPLSRDRQD